MYKVYNISVIVTPVTNRWDKYRLLDIINVFRKFKNNLIHLKINFRVGIQYLINAEVLELLWGEGWGYPLPTPSELLQWNIYRERQRGVC